MTVAPHEHLRPAARSRKDFADPISYIHREHDLQFEICERLEALSNFPDEPIESGQLESIHHYLTVELAHHIDDEEIGLFPVLRQRCQDSQILDNILFQLTCEHDLDQSMVDPILSGIEAIMNKKGLPDARRFANAVRGFVETQRRHLAWENKVVLPLAEAQLTQEDVQSLGKSMAVRRGLDK